MIHKNTLNLFMGIARNRNFFEYDIAERQLAMKTPDDKSWFNMVRFILQTYNLPSIFSCLKDKCQNQNGRET